jgi:hypothetical protein
MRFSISTFEIEFIVMKSILVLLFLFLITYNESNAQVTAKDFSKLEWLTGEWNRTNTKVGMSGIEKWIKNSDSELQGRGISLKGVDTSFVEKTKLIIKDNSIYYVADVPENKQLVYFKLTAITNNSFTCENPQHDFPKKITYNKDGFILKATISGNGKSIDYLFERKR